MYFVIQVQTGKENKTIKEMEERISDYFRYEVFTPKYTMLKKYKGEWKEIIKPYFPGYIFVETEDPKELFKQLSYVPSFTKLLGREGLTDNFLSLNEQETRTLDILCSKHQDRVTKLSSVVIKEGMKIQVLSGPLLGQESYIKKINLHKRTVTIPISIAGRSADIQVGIDIVGEMIN